MRRVGEPIYIYILRVYIFEVSVCTCGATKGTIELGWNGFGYKLTFRRVRDPLRAWSPQELPGVVHVLHNNNNLMSRVALDYKFGGHRCER